MSREIKFRVWDKVWKEMSYIDLCDLAEGDDYWYDGETSVWEVMNDATSEQRRYAIQQYTGLKDKKGKEVYEGDIVSYIFGKPNGDSVEVYSETVEFNYGQLLHLTYADYVEVIGNIYEREVTNAED